MITQEFENMVCSFTGCDGGNPKSEIWFCGLEPGLASDQEAMEINIQNITREECPYNFELDDEYTYSAKVSQKICWFINDFYNYNWNYKNTRQFIKDYKIFYSSYNNGFGFKMNIFPIQFSEHADIYNWDSDDRKLIEKTGITNFQEYRDIVMKKRGAFFRNLAKENSPKFIICFGNSDLMIQEYCDFWELNTSNLTYNEEKHFYAIDYNNKTKIFITKFFGQGGILSHNEMRALAESIKNLLK
ncbi:hypothetical protein QJU89_01580 [Pasteurella skyensis]|uniref:Uncharacterized protein n=1 Tax=Phocoenobacter skyensis TaxID=97481 RepID=A0AAJ6NAW9_9PAST|nr:hypothetical protein [Pasteurella skyensis]MDP8161589.1 hypothetical protein [Pasteurella skyensis]MDP8173423.1 hypothetical protein [Pasteurella skyensis]MDP8175983.1 hypothetical protein [Pasteurella skyensis]MDP8177951.1 hypothetical protein [Pasteurella skyensis]MDP8182390.1 hypothetical protein [Pasteurella skyensis]